MYNNKLHIEIFILVFMFTVISLCILFSCYYISPNNYTLYDYNESYNNNYISSKEYTIKPNEQQKLKYSKYKNKKLRIYKSNDLANEQLSIIIENKFKSDNVCVNKNKLIKLVNSDLIIKNTSSNIFTITVNTYS
jgi:hypothetical protein